MIDLIRRVVQQELARSRSSALGVVTAIFPHEAADDENNFEASVRLKHADLELRRVPIAVGHVGAAAAPRVGDLVLVQFVDGDLNLPVIVGRLYHADDRPPLHKADELLFEQRVADDTINQLRFAADGAIYLQRKVTKPEDNSEALATIAIDPKGQIELRSGEKIAIVLKGDDSITILADGKTISITCQQLNVEAEVKITGNSAIEGDLKVSQGAGGPSTTISGHTITGS